MFKDRRRRDNARAKTARAPVFARYTLPFFARALICFFPSRRSKARDFAFCCSDFPEEVRFVPSLPVFARCARTRARARDVSRAAPFDIDRRFSLDAFWRDAHTHPERARARLPTPVFVLFFQMRCHASRLTTLMAMTPSAHQRPPPAFMRIMAKMPSKESYRHAEIGRLLTKYSERHCQGRVRQGGVMIAS